MGEMMPQIETQDLLAALSLFDGSYQTISVFTEDLSEGARRVADEGWVPGERGLMFRVNASIRETRCDLVLGLLVGQPFAITRRKIFAVQFDPRERQWEPYDGSLLRWMKERLLRFTTEDAARLEMLNGRVTNAIYTAEHLPAGSTEAKDAFLAVSQLEEKIALLTAPNELEGEIARLGAVRAAINSGSALRAICLADLYLRHALDPSVAQKLREIALRAQQVWALT